MQQLSCRLSQGSNWKLPHRKAPGYTTTSFCTKLCATVFGKEESGGGFSFSQTGVDDIVASLKDFLTGGVMAFFPTLPTYFLQPLVHLCISGELGCCRLAGLRC